MAKRNGRLAMRDQLQATWSVLEPREPGTPFTKRDIEAVADTAKAIVGDQSQSWPIFARLPRSK